MDRSGTASIATKLGMSSYGKSHYDVELDQERRTTEEKPW